MSTQEIETFSLDTVTQEEKDFLVYMYGDDLEKVSELNFSEIDWWVKAFQAVKAGKRPKFNIAAAFGAHLWALRKKNFLFFICMTLMWFVFQILGDISSTFFSTWIQLLVSSALFGFFGPQVLIVDYLKNIQKNKDIYKKGRLPFLWVFGEIITLLFFLILTFSIFFAWFNYERSSFLLSNSLFRIMLSAISCIYSIGWAIALMKFWLPAKKINEA